jgi:hypothetical protein
MLVGPHYAQGWTPWLSAQDRLSCILEQIHTLFSIWWPDQCMATEIYFVL